MPRFLFLIILGFSLLTQGCISGDKKGEGARDPESIYFDYRVNGNEEDSLITVLLHFRQGDEEGDAFKLPDPASVMLDGQVVAGDSSKMGGYYYEVQLPLSSFSGHHKILFTGLNGKKYEEEFDFQPISIIRPAGNMLRNDSIVFEFAGLKPEDYLRVLMTDTTFPGPGINRLDTVRNGLLIIPAVDVSALVPGPVQIMFTREFEKPLENVTKSGGRLLITYRLTREFILKN